MQISCLLLPILLPILTIILPLSAQIPPQPTATTANTCLNDCLKQGSLIFAASDLRNFQKIILHIEEFCNTHKKLLKCAQSCTGEDREELAKTTSLSAFICKDKIEEFRLVKECMGSKEDIDSVNKCSTECGHPSNATIQLDSSPIAPVNPFTPIDSVTQVCSTIECVMKCSIVESNKICAGSGYLFRDIGFKQVLEANDQLQNDAFNSSSATQQLTKTYLESLPQQCTYIINPINYNTTFVQDEVNDETKTMMSEEGNKDKEGMEQMTSEMFNTNKDGVNVRIFGAEFTTQSTGAPEDDDLMTKPIPSHEPKRQEEEAEAEEEEASIMSTSVPSTSTDDRSMNMEEDEEEGATTAVKEEKHKPERKEEEEEDEWRKDGSTTTATQELNENDEEGENNDEMVHNTMQEMTERTIVVVNDDKDDEIDSNTVREDNAIKQQQQEKDATKQGIRERITLSLILILPLTSLYFSY
ncbi:Chondroitin proteoglycan 4 family protein [Acanthocheilonema viteae]